MSGRDSLSKIGHGVGSRLKSSLIVVTIARILQHGVRSMAHGWVERHCGLVLHLVLPDVFDQVDKLSKLLFTCLQ